MPFKILNVYDIHISVGQGNLTEEFHAIHPMPPGIKITDKVLQFYCQAAKSLFAAKHKQEPCDLNATVIAYSLRKGNHGMGLYGYGLGNDPFIPAIVTLDPSEAIVEPQPLLV